MAGLSDDEVLARTRGMSDEEAMSKVSLDSEFTSAFKKSKEEGGVLSDVGRAVSKFLAPLEPAKGTFAEKPKAKEESKPFTEMLTDAAAGIVQHPSAAVGTILGGIAGGDWTLLLAPEMELSALGRLGALSKLGKTGAGLAKTAETGAKFGAVQSAAQQYADTGKVSIGDVTKQALLGGVTAVIPGASKEGAGAVVRGAKAVPSAVLDAYAPFYSRSKSLETGKKIISESSPAEAMKYAGAADKEKLDLAKKAHDVSAQQVLDNISPGATSESVANAIVKDHEIKTEHAQTEQAAELARLGESKDPYTLGNLVRTSVQKAKDAFEAARDRVTTPIRNAFLSASRSAEQKGVAPDMSGVSALLDAHIEQQPEGSQARAMLLRIKKMVAPEQKTLSYMGGDLTPENVSKLPPNVRAQLEKAMGIGRKASAEQIWDARKELSEMRHDLETRGELGYVGGKSAGFLGFVLDQIDKELDSFTRQHGGGSSYSDFNRTFAKLSAPLDRFREGRTGRAIAKKDYADRRFQEGHVRSPYEMEPSAVHDKFFDGTREGIEELADSSALGIEGVEPHYRSFASRSVADADSQGVMKFIGKQDAALQMFPKLRDDLMRLASKRATHEALVDRIKDGKSLVSRLAASTGLKETQEIFTALLNSDKGLPALSDIKSIIAKNPKLKEPLTNSVRAALRDTLRSVDGKSMSEMWKSRLRDSVRATGLFTEEHVRELDKVFQGMDDFYSVVDQPASGAKVSAKVADYARKTNKKAIVVTAALGALGGTFGALGAGIGLGVGILPFAAKSLIKWKSIPAEGVSGQAMVTSMVRSAIVDLVLDPDAAKLASEPATPGNVRKFTKLVLDKVDHINKITKVGQAKRLAAAELQRQGQQ